MAGAFLTSLIGAAVGALTSAAASLFAAGRRAAVRQRASERGLQCLLRAEIIRTYEKSCERGYCPLYVKESVKRAYDSYHKLGGNDVATELCHKLYKMNEVPQSGKN